MLFCARMGGTNSTEAILDVHHGDEDIYPELPVKKSLGETVVKLVHVKKGLCTVQLGCTYVMKSTR